MNAPAAAPEMVNCTLCGLPKDEQACVFCGWKTGLDQATVAHLKTKMREPHLAHRIRFARIKRVEALVRARLAAQ